MGNKRGTESEVGWWCERTRQGEWAPVGWEGVFGQFNNYVLSISYIPGTVLGASDVPVNFSWIYICGVWEGTDS